MVEVCQAFAQAQHEMPSLYTEKVSRLVRKVGFSWDFVGVVFGLGFCWDRVGVSNSAKTPNKFLPPSVHCWAHEPCQEPHTGQVILCS